MALLDSISIKKYWIYIGLILLFLAIVFRWTNHGWEKIVDSDGKGYYAYLPAIINFHDLNFDYFLNGKVPYQHDYTTSFLYFIDGHFVIKYPPGVAFLILPFYLIAHLLTIVTGFETNGYSFFYQIFVSLAAIFYSLLGSYYIFKLLLSFNLAEKKALITSFLILFSTNLLNYTIYEPSMSHCYSFAAVAGFSFHLRKFFIENKNNDWLIACVWLGIILLIRQINGLIILGIPLIAGDLKIFRNGIVYLFKKPKFLFLGIIISSAFLSIQPLLWHAQNGHWIVWTYLNETFNWDKPAVLKVLFSYRKGWLLYTPLFLFLIPSFIIQLIQKNWFLFFANLFFWLPLVYVISCWWCWYYGGSFGQRVFIDFYPLAAINLGLLLSMRMKKIAAKLISVILATFLIINLIQTYQYLKYILNYEKMDKDKYWSIFLNPSSYNVKKLYENVNKYPPSDFHGILIHSWFTDFDEGSSDWTNWRNDDLADESLSGNKVIILQKGSDNSPTLKTNITSDVLENSSLLINVWYKGEYVAPELELIVSIDDTIGGTPYRFSTKVDQLKIVNQKDDWKEVQCNIKLGTLPYKGLFKLNTYLYNPGIHPMTFDDLAIFLYKDSSSINSQ